MLLKDIKNGLTVGELRKVLKKFSDDTPILLENLDDKLYYKNGFEDAILPCDSNQFNCYEFKMHGQNACKHCYLAHSYSAASVTVEADNVLYLNVSI